MVFRCWNCCRLVGKQKRRVRGAQRIFLQQFGQYPEQALQGVLPSYRSPKASACRLKLFSTTAEPSESPKTFTAVLKRSSSQSTDRISPIYSTGNPTAFNTITIVTSPASGMPAAPMAAMVAVTAITSCEVIVSSNPIACAMNMAATAS